MRNAESDKPAASRVPLADFGTVHRELEEELVAAFRQVLRSGRYILGPLVNEFEARIARWLDIDHCIAVSSGTDALLAALLALEIAPGDEVITSPLTFVSTAEAIVRVGATPVFADVCSRCLCLDPSSVATRVTPRTRAIIPVHLFGDLGHTEELLRLAKARGIFVVEDACQAFGSSTAVSRKAGTLGEIGCFSFFPTKVLGALGDAGLVCTHNGELANRLRSLRSHGSSGKHRFHRLGGNFRMDALQAALLNVLIDRVDGWIAARSAVADRYTSAFSRVDGITTPSTCMSGERAWSVYTIRVSQQRDTLVEHLTACGIETATYYPATLADQPLFQSAPTNPADLRHARQAAREVLSLPIYPGISLAEQLLVVQRVSDHLTRRHDLHYEQSTP